MRGDITPARRSGRPRISHADRVIALHALGLLGQTALRCASARLDHGVLVAGHGDGGQDGNDRHHDQQLD